MYGQNEGKHEKPEGVYGKKTKSNVYIRNCVDSVATCLFWNAVPGRTERRAGAEIYTVNSGVVADLQYTLDEMAQLDD